MLPTAFVVVLAAVVVVVVQVSDAKSIDKEGVEQLTQNLFNRDIEDKSDKSSDLKKTYGYIKNAKLKKIVKKNGLPFTMKFLVKRWFLHLFNFAIETIFTPFQISWASKYKFLD